MEPIRALSVFEVRWVCRGEEGRCQIRGLCEDDVLGEFERHPSWYGAPGEPALAVSVRRLERRERARVP